jgi:hypothetical protein
MEDDRAAVEQYARLCQCILSPIRLLPSEILINIFDFFTPVADEWGTQRPSGHLTVDAGVAEDMGRVANTELLRISQVCHRWHRLIMGTPSLWSVINLDLTWWSRPHQARRMILLKTILERGGSFPLTLSARCRFQSHNGSASGVLSLLARYSRRWKKYHSRFHPNIYWP